jgi:hypothetical protein
VLGVNGATSVLGSVSGVIIALSWGFSARSSRAWRRISSR